MHLTALDWAAIAAYLLITLVLGLYFRGKSGKSTADYFVSGREVSWWLAGTSMVATTFAADTPLAVCGLVYTQGVAGNWLWWSFLPSGMMTVFLFARLWRRSGLITDVQFAEFRYHGKPAAFLRGFRAVYLGLLMNCLILGWVTKAMVNIISTSLGISDAKALAICVFFLMPFTGIYVSLGGLWGVLWTDLFQFVLKMAIVIAVAWYGVRAVGGMSQLLAKLAEMRNAAGPGASDITKMLPDFSRGLTGEALWTLPVITFVVHLAVQWWAFWYPGAEPGGGGYVAQRIFSARDEKNGMLSVLWFNLAHYALRPWPWILTALVAVVLYPGLAQPERGYMMVATRHTPHALLGILLAGFMAAFMSTVATQLNWGSSYLVEDFYRRFVKKKASEAHYVNASRLATFFLVVAAAWVSMQLQSVSEGWKIVLELGAGTGGVYLLRWYWWRVNAWSEISAMAAALVTTLPHAQSFAVDGACGTPGAVPGLGRGDFCEDHVVHHGSDDAGVGDGHLADSAGGHQKAGGVLPASEARYPRVGAGGKGEWRGRGHPGLGEEFVELDNRLRFCVRRIVRHRATLLRAIHIGTRPGAGIVDLRCGIVSPYAEAHRMARLVQWPQHNEERARITPSLRAFWAGPWTRSTFS